QATAAAAKALVYSVCARLCAAVHARDAGSVAAGRAAGGRVCRPRCPPPGVMHWRCSARLVVVDCAHRHASRQCVGWRRGRGRNCADQASCVSGHWLVVVWLRQLVGPGYCLFYRLCVPRLLVSFAAGVHRVPGSGPGYFAAHVPICAIPQIQRCRSL
ncbi:hypothetical protein LPJ69_005307, partial [Coemansia sp. RSA 1752]